ncbi:gamma-glutamyltranspeptidase / glutathione hydrolase [Tistlia consotensis]|uniref:Gamma-glutamyltransferase 2. Threonine peptidase. MEROPS family T03 n=1 Tax=Tistlia consotensis USBA 355 TaxID=560819 RepID=A0A1Y6B5S9_9PROT|nr:gamma-glutamyltransferase family protein [Tistlia consotensis]SME93767.1 gamma-glutamyltransferase 2. Threonine peptidase. MEROPS family T03 [Tistlia consotensis USBA 355]SNR28800.1 gamma-glutamyltranspeptidase / glutathione hydrolase [Tistlia consotensis]
MLQSLMAYRGMATAPHHLAAQAGLSVLREGGNAVEAMVAMASTIAVVYPHMNGLGGDGFWLIAAPGKAPVAIEACGTAAAAATPALYEGHAAVPTRGPLAANTVAGAVDGWRVALEVSKGWGGRLPLGRLLEEALWHAREGVAVTESQARLTLGKLDELLGLPGFAETFLLDGRPPAPGERLRQPGLAATLERLAEAGLDDFYRGELAAAIGAGLQAAGSPVAAADLAGYRARRVAPLTVELAAGRLHNLPPPTQGLASLAILALYERMAAEAPEGFDFLHRLVEATKRAFLIRDRVVGDPEAMTEDPAACLTDAALDAELAAIDRRRAAPWPQPLPGEGDTIWMGAIDGEGRAVSFIQSLYWEFGSGVTLADLGLVWQNRGAAFQLQPGSPRSLVPGRRPFHTLNPALARLSDGSTLVYGCMGGEGQPQTQAAVFARHALHGIGLQRAVSRPRWLLGRTWGAESVTLKLESRFDPALIEALAAAGHAVEPVGAYDEVMGHAGAIRLYPDGRLEGAADPRSDGSVAGF